MTAAQVITPSPLVLPEDEALRRYRPRASRAPEPDGGEAYDDRTLWYDAFRHDGDIVLSGPPLLNLKAAVLDRAIRVGERQVEAAQVVLSDVERTQRSLLRGVTGDAVTVDDGERELGLDVGDDHRDLFTDRRVIVTRTAAGRRTRLDQWLTYHQRAHGVTGALVYVTDPAAVDRSRDQLSAAGLDAAVVVSWPFPAGPGSEADRWAYDFSYYSALEHARLRFLQRAGGVMNVGVDQLVVTDDQRSVFDLAEAAPRHLVRFWQLRVESGTTASAVPRHRGFRDFTHHRSITTQGARWVVVPDALTSVRQWQIHTVEGIAAPVSARVAGREFVALADRPDPPRAVHRGFDQPDRGLLAALDRFLPARPAPAGGAASPAASPRSSTPVRRWRGRLRRRRSSADSGTAATGDEYGYLFVMTYGRSGSTLLQGILSSIPGYLLRGENNAMMYALYTYHRRSMRERRRLDRPEPLPRTHPFYGIDGYPDEIAFRDMRTLALDTILRPEQDTRVVGFKEIEWTEGNLVDFVRFLRDVFPGARFVVNTRDHDEVARSKWWAERPDAAEQIKAAETKIMEAAESLGDAAYHVHYNDYVSDAERLRGLFAWLGEPFDLDAVRRAMARRYSY